MWPLVMAAASLAAAPLDCRLARSGARDMPAAEDLYRRDDGMRLEVSIRLLPAVQVKDDHSARPLLFVSKMTIDADGAGDAWEQDPAGQPETTLRDEDEESLDPTQVPYFVLPVGFRQAHPEVRLGDLAAVTFHGVLAYAIFGDEGPEGKIGEGSIALAEDLGIDADPMEGGVADGVTFIVFPGSGDGEPLPPDEIARRGEALLAQAGLEDCF
ncbi:MAG: glycoside hydrolase family 75 protein [Elusimicrobia bacterium]|nr:glycoside hydrolase family 75 protein [Elusimicrobiota bacterium]